MMPVLFIFYSNFCSISTGWPTASPAPENPGKSELCALIRNQARRNKLTLQTAGWRAVASLTRQKDRPPVNCVVGLRDLNLG
jgi:hypothetical protein